MMPIFALPGEITPGQLGPMRRDLEVLSFDQTFTMSSVGMPSVMATMSGMPASSASRMASAANGGGTKITVALAPLFSTASATVLKTGHPSWVVPPLPGVTPPTTLVPYSAQPFAWKVPSLPVIPCTIRRVFLSTKTAINEVLPSPHSLRDPLHPSSWNRLRNLIRIPSESCGPLPHSCLRDAERWAALRRDSSQQPRHLAREHRRAECRRKY